MAEICGGELLDKKIFTKFSIWIGGGEVFDKAKIFKVETVAGWIGGQKNGKITGESTKTKDGRGIKSTNE